MTEEKKCNYCGEVPGTEKIADPNLDMGSDIDWSDDKNWWIVCSDCKEVIKYQQLLSMGSFLGVDSLSIRASNKLDEIAKRTGVPIITASIFKDDNGKLDYVSIIRE